MGKVRCSLVVEHHISHQNLFSIQKEGNKEFLKHFLFYNLLNFAQLVKVSENSLEFPEFLSKVEG
jgi:hypothetical protein